MIAHLDINTLLFAAALTSAVCAGARFLLWRMHPGIPGLYHWALAGVAGTLSLLFIMSYGYYRWTPSLSIAQLLALAGLLFSWHGFRRFLGRPPISRLVIVSLMTIFVIWLFYAHAVQTVFVRALINATLIAILSALIARELLFSNQPGRAAIRATGWIFAINAVIFFTRVMMTHHIMTAPHDPLNPSGVTGIVLLWWLFLTISITLGMFLMTAERLEAELVNQANLDPLTGAHNRRAFSLITDKIIARAHRHARPLSVLIMDLDHFKQINDQLGHETGDEILCRFVDNAKDIFRSEDVFCRFGGEEFVAMLPDTTAQQAFIAAERLRQSLEKESITLASISTIASSVTVSIGIAELGPNESLDELLRRADSALYLAKDRGRNRCEHADTTAPDITNQNVELNGQGTSS